ncbi:MAG: hypothetical protein KKA63_03035 [Gammaproteobacteria bacterium]|nr:hypothetical protein [Gammaproteobacteria bacterium]
MFRLPRVGIVIAMFLSACGGGGGGGSTSTTPANLAYTGSTTPATITVANGSALASNVLGGASSTNIMTGASVSPASRNNISAYILELAKAARNAPAQASTSGIPATGAVVSIPATTVPGTSGGTLTMSGQVDNTTMSGSMTLVFSSYSNGVMRMSGTLDMAFSAWDAANAVPLTSTITFSNIQVTNISSNITDRMDGSFLMQINVAANTETITVNAIMEQSPAGPQSKLQNFVMTNTYDSILFPTSVSEVISGRVFDSLQGYVDITTPTPMVITNLNTDLFPTSGVVLLTGANGALGGATKARLTAILNQQVQLDIDVDGDNIYDNATQYLWANL